MPSRQIDRDTDRDTNERYIIADKTVGRDVWTLNSIIISSILGHLFTQQKIADIFSTLQHSLKSLNLFCF